MGLLGSISYLVQVFLLGRRFLIKKIKIEPPLEFKVASKDVIGRTIFKSGEYDRQLSDYILKNIDFSDNDVFLDVGANIGWYSILLSSQKNGLKKVVAFEPDPLNFSLLNENIEKNGTRNVVAVNSAVSDEVSTATLYKYSENNLGRHSLLPINSGECLEVKTTTLDDYWDTHMTPQEYPRLIKIDTEGYEYNIVRGAIKVLEKSPIVLAEFSPEYMRRGGVDPADFLDFMHGQGYQPHRVEEGRLCQVTLSELEKVESYMNLLWIRP